MFLIHLLGFRLLKSCILSYTKDFLSFLPPLLADLVFVMEMRERLLVSCLEVVELPPEEGYLSLSVIKLFSQDHYYALTQQKER